MYNNSKQSEYIKHVSTAYIDNCYIKWKTVMLALT